MTSLVFMETSEHLTFIHAGGRCKFNCLKVPCNHDDKTFFLQITFKPVLLQVISNDMKPKPLEPHLILTGQKCI